MLNYCCKRRIRTFTRRLAKAQELISSGQSSLNTLCLSRNPHPRDRRAWLPISTPHIVVVVSKTVVTFNCVALFDDAKMGTLAFILQIFQ